MTQGEIERLPEEIVRIFQGLEKRIMNDVVRRIWINGFSTASADWQISRVQQLGESEENIRAWVSEALTATEKELDEIFSDAVYEEFMEHDRAYRVMGKPRIPYRDNLQLQSLVEAIRKQTKGELENITRTMAVGAKGADGRVILTPLMSFYRSTLDNAVMDIESGAFDYQRVLMRTVKVLKASGIRSVTYEHGPSIRIEAGVRRAVLTGFRQVQEKINEQTAAELGTDYYEVTYHVGARPTHQPWQGRVWSWKDLHDVCGLGTVTGLHGANCYHDYNAFIPGVSVRTYTDEQLDEMIAEENTPKKYSDKEYTTYEALQEQRRLERNARATREEIMMLTEGRSDPDQIILAKARLQGILRVYNDFSEKMGLPTQYDRIYLDGLKGEFRLTETEKTIYQQSKRDARFSERFIDYNNGQKDTISIKNILNELNRSETGKEVAEYIFKHDELLIQMCYNMDNPSGILGDQFGSDIRIFASETKTVKRTTEVLIHEITHYRYDIGGSQWAECVCIAQERKHHERKAELTVSELRDIIKEVKELYPEYPWR